ncbi:8477_t:CDS:1, partial [Dentiscutata erythropus]
IFYFGGAIPVQESFSCTILGYSDNPNNGYCSRNCVAIIKNFNPSDYDMRNDSLKLDIGYFTNCNAVFSNSFYTVTKVLYVDLVDGQGYFHFSDIVPVQTNITYQFWAYFGFSNYENSTDPTDNECFGGCMGAAQNLIPTDDIIISSF